MGPMERAGADESELVSFNGSHYRDPAFSWRNSQGVTDIEFLNSTAIGEQYANNIFVGDINADFANGTATCLASLGAPVRHWNLPAAVSVPAMVSSLNRHGLHFALLDPYNLDLPFSAIKSLAALRHIDLMIHLSTGSMQRNLSTYTDSDNQTLDAFAPGWRERVDMNTTPLRQREQIIQHWFALLRGLQLESAPEMRRMRNSTNTTIYWLIFASRAEVARKFWAIAQTYVDGSTNDLFGGSNGRD